MKSLWQYIKKGLIVLALGGYLCARSLAGDVDIPDDLKDDRELPREERIRRHQKRVQLILDARKKSKDEEQKRKLDEAREKAQEAAKSNPQPEPHPQEARPRHPSEARPEQSAESFSISPVSSQTMANTILYFYPFDNTVSAGENFLTDVELYNLDKRKIEELKLAIRFDPTLIKPIYVNDSEMNELIDGSPEYMTDLTQGAIYYACKLKESHALDDRSILRIVWTAIKPAEYTEIGMDLSSENKTVLLEKGRDILGIANTPEDGVITFGLTINSKGKKESEKLVIDPELQMQLGWKEKAYGNIALRMQTGKTTVKPGEIFDVSIHLLNPDAENIDKLGILIKFDPEILKVADWDKRNWITQGINIQDGFAHKTYPFDFHLRNDVNNHAGRIDYRMGSSRMKSFPSGELARIRFKAVSPAEETFISFDYTTTRHPPTTTITSMGRERLSPRQWQEDEFHRLSIQVKSR